MSPMSRTMGRRGRLVELDWWSKLNRAPTWAPNSPDLSFAHYH